MGKDEVRIKIKIDSNSQELVLMKQQVQDLGKSFTNTDSYATAFLSRLSFGAGAVGGLYLITNALNDIKNTGFEANKSTQKLTNSLATSIAITSANIDSMGKQISLSEKYAMATDEARLSLEQLNKINVDTPHDLDQTAKIYDAMYAGMKKVGATSEEIIDITKKLSIAVGDKVGFDAMLSAMDGLSTGTVETASEMGRFLRVIGLSNEAIKNSTNVVQLFKDKLADVKAIESFDTKLSNLTNSYTMLSKEVMESTFNTIEDNLQPAAEILDSLKDNLPTITNVVGEIVQVGISIGATTLVMKGYTTATKIATTTNILFGGSFGAVNRNILMTSLAVGTFNRILKASPFGLAATAIYGISESFSEASNRADIFKKSLTEVSSELDIIRYKERLQEVNQELKKMDKNIAGYNDAQKLMYQGGYDLAYKEKQKLEKLITEASPTKKGTTVYDFSQTEKEINDLVEKTLNPYGAKLDEINKKWQPNFENLQKNGKDTSKLYQAWHKDISDLDKEEADKKEKLLKANEKLFKDQAKTAEELNKAYQDISQIGMSEYEKGLISISDKTQSWIKDGVSLSDALTAQSKLLDELNAKKALDNTKEDLSYYERLVQLKSDSLEKEIELANISYSQKTLDIQDLNRPIAEKEKLVSLETELYNKTIERLRLDDQANKLDEVSTSYQDMLDAQISLIDATNDWNSNLTGTAASLSDIASATTNLSKLNLTSLKNEDKLRTEYEKNKLKFYDNEEKLKELDIKYAKDKGTLDEKNLSVTLIGFSNISAAVSTLFEQGSKEAAVSQIAQSSLALVEGTRAILTAGTGDPYTAIPRMISMAAMVSSLFSNIGIAFGMNKTSTYSDAFSSIEANTGIGTVLGDTKAQSESIKNSMDILENFAEPQYATLLLMNKHLEAIANNIGGVTSLLIQQGGFAFGDGYEGFDTGYKNNISLNDMTLGLMNPINSIISKIPIIGEINGLFGGVVNSVLGGIFGKTKVSQSLTDSGITFADALLTNAIENFNGSAYQTIATTVTKKSYFKKSSKTNISSYFEALDDETERQFSLVLGNLYNTVLTAGVALDSTEAQTAAKLKNYVVSIGKISLKGKTGDQIQETLEAIFGSIGDNIAITAFPALVPFQQIGEGLFETMTRVATGMESAEFYISRLGNRFDDVIYTAIGNKQGDVGFEALLQSIEKVENATYPTNNGLLNIIENLSGTAEELYAVYVNLDELRDRLVFLGLDAQGLSSTMIYGAGTITDLQSGFKAYFENFLSEDEQLAYKTEQLTQKFNSLGLALPSSNLAFKDLLLNIDETTASGQELFGRLIVLSEEFAEISSLRVDALQDELDITNGTISNIKEISTSLDNVITSLRSGLDNSSTNLLDKFNKSMSTSLLLSATDDYTALANSVKDTINYSSALNNTDYFGSLREMQYAQSVAANQFEGININIEDELSVLQEIASNTKNMITALSNLTTSVNALKESSEQTASNTAETRYVS